MKFKEVCEFSGESNEVWARASDLESVPTYWHDTREFIVARSEGKISADVKFAFGGKGKAEITVEQGNRTVTINYLRGSFSGAFKLLERWNESHFRVGTKNALRRLCSGPEQ